MEFILICTARPLFSAKLFVKLQYGEFKYEDCEFTFTAPPYQALLFSQKLLDEFE
jgi:hypothetical protein